jgi:hypothetical protein
MTNPIQLHVGYVGITREGKRVEIIKVTDGAIYPYSEESGRCYKSGGAWCSVGRPDDFDIVGPWVAPVDYNDGKWHRWAGGECPVHPSSVVHATFLVGIGEPRTDSRLARMFHWGACASPIVAFRVTEGYVEPPKVPREFWVPKATAESFYERKPADTTRYIHVREVLTDD